MDEMGVYLAAVRGTIDGAGESEDRIAVNVGISACAKTDVEPGSLKGEHQTGGMEWE